MSRKASFYLLTDVHYVSPRNWVEGRPITLRERGDQIALKATPQILDSFLDKILADDTADTVVFTGDNVNNGDLNSHEEFRARCEKLTAAGKKVYVINATHDYCGAGDDENGFGACRYTETGTEPIPFMRKAELFDYYFDYGPKQAISVHRESRSYVVQLCEGARLIMIDDNGNGRSHCGLFEDGVQWLKTELEAARAAGDAVLLATHHPVIPPMDVYAHVADFEMYGGYRELREIMCEYGVHAVFTGHTHMHSIRKYEDDRGRYFYDIATIALANSAAMMRRVDVDADEGVCSVSCVGIETLKGVDTGGKTPHEYLYPINFPGIFEQLLPLGAKDPDAFMELAEGPLPVDKLKKFKFAIRPACRKALKLKLSTAAKFGGVWKTLSPEQRAEAKEKKVADVAFAILRHIYPGNGPFPPQTTENIVLTGVVKKLEKIAEKRKIEAVQKLIPPGSSLVEMAQDVLYNNRTGDDDNLQFPLK
ncbi:MAG: metallophosphoesterase [Clostridia bacterium]|nr:metallophosphoesterase [Clostridia bacterium]